MITRKGTEVPVDYRMLRRGDRWYVYDVRISREVSLVSTFRSQFNTVIQTSSYALVRKTQERIEELREES